MTSKLSGGSHRRWHHPFLDPPRRTPRGLNLVEMAVAIAVMSLLVGIGIPYFFSQRAMAQDTVARSNVAAAAHGALGYYTQHDIASLPHTLDNLLDQLRANEPALEFIVGDSNLPNHVSVARHSDTLLVMSARSHSGLCVVGFTNLKGPSFLSNHSEETCNAESFDYVYGYLPIQQSAPGPADPTPETSPPPTTTPTTVPESPTTTEPPPTTTTTTLPPTTTTTVPSTTTTTTAPPTTTTTLPPTTTTTTLPPTTTTTIPPTTTTTVPPTTTTTQAPPPASPGEFYEGYSLMAMGTGSCGVDIDLNNFSIAGGVHTNGYVNIKANNGSVEGPATAVGTVNLNGTAFNGLFSPASRITAPELWHPSEWAPGSARAAELNKDWHYWPSGMSITKNKDKVAKGVHYVNGNVNIELGSNLKIEGTTIIATGNINIDVNGPVELAPHKGEELTLFAYSYGQSSCTTRGIDLDANSAKLKGVFYSPFNKTRLSAHANSNFTGNVIASAVEITGNVLWMFLP